MSQTVVLFHSALGLRPAVGKFADRLRAEGHVVYTPDLFDGRVFDTLEAGTRHRESLGIEPLIRRATASVGELPLEVVYAGFSMGAAPAQLLAGTRRGARGAILMHGALPLTMIGIDEWPQVPVQMHYAEKDPWVDGAHVDSLSMAVRKANQECSIFTYDGSAHLFADDGLSDYNQDASEAMAKRVLAFLHNIDSE